MGLTAVTINIFPTVPYCSHTEKSHNLIVRMQTALFEWPTDFRPEFFCYSIKIKIGKH